MVPRPKTIKNDDFYKKVSDSGGMLVFGPAEAVLSQDLVRLGGEVAVGEEQHLDRLA